MNVPSDNNGYIGTSGKPSQQGTSYTLNYLITHSDFNLEMIALKGLLEHSIMLHSGQHI